MEDDKEVTKLISFNEIESRKEIITKIWYRRPDKLQKDTPDPQDCSEDELLKYYGEPEKMDVRTPDDLDKYYGYGCFIICEI